MKHLWRRLLNRLTTLRVDEHVFTMLPQFFDVTGITDMESLEQIACFQSRPVETGDIHTDSHIGDTDLLLYQIHIIINPNSP